MAKSDSVTSPWAKAFCSFIQFTSIQNNKIKFKSINHTILQYWETISVQKNSFWSWNGGKSEKVIVWHLSLTNFCIWHHESYDQKIKEVFFFIFKYQSLLQKNRNHIHLLSKGCPFIIDLRKNTWNVTLSLCHTIKTVFSDFLKMKSFVG